MKKNSNRRILTISVIAIIGIGLLASMSQQSTQGVASFSIISENAEEGDIPVASAVCFSKTTTKLQSSTDPTSSGIVESDNSPFLADNPQFSFTGADLQSGETSIDSIKHFLKMRCEVGFAIAGNNNDQSNTFENQEACEDPDRSDECQLISSKFIEVRPSSMEIQIYATNEQGVKERVYIGNHQTDTVRLNDGKEEILMFADIPTEQILKFMDKGNYDSLLEIRSSGILNMIIEDFSLNGVNLETVHYYIGQNDIPTFFNIGITEDLVEVGTELPETESPPGFEDPEVKCTSPAILDKTTGKCITPETQEQGEQKKQNLGDHTEDLGGDPKENKSFFDILVELWIKIMSYFKTS